MKRAFGATLAGVFMLAACNGGGDDDRALAPAYCVGTFEDGDTGFDCAPSCSGVDPFANNPLPEAIDNDGHTYRAFGLPANGGSITLRITAPSGMSFPGGVDAGALLRFPASTPVSASYTLYNGTTPVNSTSGGTIANGTIPAGAGGDAYYAVTPAATINRIDLAISVSGNAAAAEFRLYEVCGDR